jgi:S1-C subfamily serine protease
MEDLKQKHEKFLYPVVRVYTAKAAGSGTIIYSQCDPTNEDGDFSTFILTNHHVIEESIKYKKDWDSVLKREIDKEFLEIPRVEIFDYVKDSTVVSSNSHRAVIVAYDKNHDLAVLKLESPKCCEFVAPLIPRDEIKELRLFMDVVVSGCSMAHEPFCTFGHLTFLTELIEQRLYTMYNAASYFGNSGGALFLKDKGYLIGVPSRLTGIQLGFGIDMVTHMGFAAHPERIYEFLDEQELKFLYDPNDSYEAAMERRDRKKKDALLELKAEIAKEGS